MIFYVSSFIEYFEVIGLVLPNCECHYINSILFAFQGNDSPGEAPDNERRTMMRNHLAMQLIASSSRSLIRPHVVVRPAQLPPIKLSEEDEANLAYNKTVVLSVFRFLGPRDLANCARVCRTWGRYSIDPNIWKQLDMSHTRLERVHLIGIVRRQPESLKLDWTNISKTQLSWLINRLPQLRTLSLQGCNWAGISSLRTCCCPPLTTLDLSYVSGLNDANLNEMLSPPTDSRPGLIDKASRLKHLKHLSLAGCDITDLIIRYITERLLCLESLDLSSCGRLTDVGVAHLAASQALPNLTSLNLANCRLLTEATLDHLEQCKALKHLDLRHTTQVSTQAVIRFAAKSEHNLHVTDVKLVEEKKMKSESMDTS